MTITQALAEIRERLEKATPGPWHIGHVSEMADGEFSADIDGPNGEQIAASYLRCNEALMASAPTDIDRLLRCVEILDEALGKISHSIGHSQRCISKRDLSVCEGYCEEANLADAARTKAHEVLNKGSLK